MERQVLRWHRFVAQNILKLHIAVEEVLAILDLRPMPRRLRAPSIDHVNGYSPALAQGRLKRKAFLWERDPLGALNRAHSSRR